MHQKKGICFKVSERNSPYAIKPCVLCPILQLIFFGIGRIYWIARSDNVRGGEVPPCHPLVVINRKMDKNIGLNSGFTTTLKCLFLLKFRLNKGKYHFRKNSY